MQLQAHIQITNPIEIKQGLVDSFKEASNVLLLDGNTSGSDTFDWMLAVGTVDEISVGTDAAFDKLQDFYDKHKDWVFGSLSYDLKNGLENLQSTHSDKIQFPDLHFFLPKYLFIYKDNKLAIHKHTSVSKFDLSILKSPIIPSGIAFSGAITNKVSKKKYINNVNLIKEHIQRGDIYEMNYCQEFYSYYVSVYAPELFYKLNKITESPFASFLNIDNISVICLSPERYLLKNINHIISQPIKGTSKRSSNDNDDKILIKNFKHTSSGQSCAISCVSRA